MFSRLCKFVLLVLAFTSGAALGDSPQFVARIPDCRVRFLDQVVLASERTGILASLDVREGDRVKDQQIVATLKDEVLKARLAFAREQAGSDVRVRESRKTAELAAAELEIAQDAIRREPNAVPKTELLRLQLDSERAQLQIEAAQLEFRLLQHRQSEAQAEVDASRLTAPFEGVVVRTFKSRGEAVQQGDPVIELISNRRVKVEGYLPIKAIQRVQVGQPVRVNQEPAAEVSDEQQGAAAEGRIVFIDIAAEPVTERVRIWAEVDNDRGQLRVGLPASLTILDVGAMPE